MDLRWIGATEEPSYGYIKPSKKQGKSHYEQIFKHKNHLHNALFYTDEGSINGQIRAAFVLLVMNFSICVYLGKTNLFTIYLKELIGILLVL